MENPEVRKWRRQLKPDGHSAGLRLRGEPSSDLLKQSQSHPIFLMPDSGNLLGASNASCPAPRVQCCLLEFERRHAQSARKTTVSATWDWRLGPGMAALIHPGLPCACAPCQLEDCPPSREGGSANPEGLYLEHS